jgi:uncharacterized protein YggE
VKWVRRADRQPVTLSTRLGSYKKQPCAWCLLSVTFAAIATLIAEMATFCPAQTWENPIGQIVGPAETITYPNQPTVSARGDGVTRALPDSMSVSFGVEARCASREECLATVSSMAQRVTAAEKAIVDPATKISTDYIAVNPTFGTPSPIQTTTLPASAIGWEFEGRVRASADSIDRMAPLVDSALSAGASDVWMSGFVSFSPDQHGEEGDRGNIFTPGRIFRPPPLPHETDIPYVILDVEAEGSTADECVRKGASLADQVVRVLADKLGSHGAAGTEEYQVRKIAAQPQHMPMPPTLPVQVQKGFYATTSVVVKTQQLDKLNAMLAAAATAGAVRGQIGYSLREENQARKEAIARAQSDAQGKAEAATLSVHMNLGKMYRTVINSDFQPGSRYVFSLAGPSSISLAQVECKSLQDTLVEARANVTVIYLLK